MAARWWDRNLVDFRGEKPSVDWRGVATFAAIGAVAARALFWLVASPWDYVVMIVVAAAALTFEIVRARR